MGYCEKTLNLAARQVGYKEEKSKGDNWTKYGRWFDTPGEGWQWFNTKKNAIPGPSGGWCSLFICWLYCQKEILGRDKARKFLGCPEPKNNLAAACGYFYDYLKAKGYKSTIANAKPGDIVFFKNGSKCAHVGIVEKVDKNNIYTIEGNKGDAVKRVTHKRSSNIYFGIMSPDYASLDKALEPSEPVADKPAPVTPAAPAKVIYKVNTKHDPLMLRCGAGTNFPIICRMPKGATVTYKGTTTGKWLKVQYKTMIGWAHGDYLKKV